MKTMAVDNIYRDTYGNLPGEYKTRTCPTRITRDFWIGEIMTEDQTWNGIPDGDTFKDPYPPVSDEYVEDIKQRPIKTKPNWVLEVKYKGRIENFSSALKAAEFLNISDDTLRQRLLRGIIPNIDGLEYIKHEDQKMTKKSGRKSWIYTIETDYAETINYETIEKAAIFLSVTTSTVREYIKAPTRSLAKKGIISVTRRQKT